MATTTLEIYRDDELDNEWAQYVASLNAQNHLIHKKNREKKKIVRRERETMINLQKHLRTLSRARVVLEQVDDLDSSSSCSSSSIDTVNIVALLDSDSDIAPVPTFPALPPSSKSIDNNHNNHNNHNNGNETESNYDSQDSELNDSHCLNDSNDSCDSSLSPKSSSSKSSSIDPLHELQYDHELEALKEELNQFKRRNFNKLCRTNSQEEVLLSVLNIDKKDIDQEQLEKCTKKAIKKYNSMTISPLPETGKNDATKKSQTMRKIHKKKKKRKRLADPYEEEWNGLDPNDYVWFDNVPEGQCYDDKELSLRDRRIQYLVVMAIENKYCSISDLTYKQNELLLLYQQSLNF